MPIFTINEKRDEIEKKWRLSKQKKWMSIFAYDDTLAKIDFADIPENWQIIFFGQQKNEKKFREKNPHLGEGVIFLPFVLVQEMYGIFHFSNAIITRGEVSFSQVLQMKKPFLWDIYHEIGGFPTAQSEDYLRFMNFGDETQKLQKKLWNDEGKISI